jgi:hypothetical protein
MAGEILLNYVTDRREMIQYPIFLEMCPQIGSDRRRSGSRGEAGAGTATTPRASRRSRLWTKAVPWDAYWKA